MYRCTALDLKCEVVRKHNWCANFQVQFMAATPDGLQEYKNSTGYSPESSSSTISTDKFLFASHGKRVNKTLLGPSIFSYAALLW